MPLHDHFRAPLDSACPWRSFVPAWAACLARLLAARLPAEHAAEPWCEFHEPDDQADEPQIVGPPDGWPPPPTGSFLLQGGPSDTAEVRVFHDFGGRKLVGCVRLACPSDKAGPAERLRLGTACAALIHEGVSLVLVDAITAPAGGLHAEVIRRLDPAASHTESDLSAFAFCPREGRGKIDIWTHPLAVGQPLPTLPIRLRDGWLPVELEAAYAAACQECRIQ